MITLEKIAIAGSLHVAGTLAVVEPYIRKKQMENPYSTISDDAKAGTKAGLVVGAGLGIPYASYITRKVAPGSMKKYVQLAHVGKAAAIGATAGALMGTIKHFTKKTQPQPYY